MLKRALGTCALTVILAVPSWAATITDLGIASPPATTPDGRPMFPFDDPRGDGVVDDVDSPLGGKLTFSSSLDHDATADANWGHAYEDDVYYLSTPSVFSVLFGGPAYFLVMGLPDGTSDFYFYVKPDGDDIGVWAPSLEGGPLYIPVGGDANGFLLSGGVSQVWLASDEPFSVGDFGIAQTPEPASLLLLGTGMAGLAARFRRRRSSR